VTFSMRYGVANRIDNRFVYCAVNTPKSRSGLYWSTALGADSEEKHEPASDIDTTAVDSLNCS
jgi:hypothetical protein